MADRGAAKANTGLEDLVFLVVASPPVDMPAVSQTGGRDVQAP